LRAVLAGEHFGRPQGEEGAGTLIVDGIANAAQRAQMRGDDEAARTVEADFRAVEELEIAHVAVEGLAGAGGHFFLAVDLGHQPIAAREAIADQAIPFVMLGDQQQALALARSVTVLRNAAGSTKRSLSPFGEKP
jgi:hypothetical protein